jgi:1,4-dihydroxy-2-naphthoate octaprenyltransferase
MSIPLSPSQPGRIRAWILAARPQTLPAAITPVVVGSAAALASGSFRWGPFIAALVAALLIQIGTNLANDYFDFRKGADTEERLGPTRVTQAGLLAPETVRNGMIATFGAAALIGVYLIVVGGWPILVIGVLSIAAGVLYTGGPWPLGYHGLGDLFTFIFLRDYRGDCDRLPARRYGSAAGVGGVGAGGNAGNGDHRGEQSARYCH